MNLKTAYQADTAGLYVGTTHADESPMEPGVFLLPARATFTAPPESWPDDKWPRWDGTQWVLVTRPKVGSTPIDPLAKLKEFLAGNPDVAKLIGNSADIPQEDA